MAKPIGFQPSVIYQDPKAAMRWLEAAFGFETAIYIEGEDGSFIHCQMRHGDGLISIGQEWDDDFKSPLKLGGKNTQLTSIQINEDVDAHCERSRAAGAVIVAEPNTQFYGDRVYRCRDPEGHNWSISQTIEAVTREEAQDRVEGMKITGMGLMPAFDLQTTYLGLDGVGGVAKLPVGPDFWATIADNPHAGGTLVTVGTGEGDWPQWEMHPSGEEVLVLLEGALSMIFEHPDGRTERHDLAPGATLVVPTGVWHRAIGQRDVRMLFITYGAGTSHRPVTAADQ